METIRKDEGFYGQRITVLPRNFLKEVTEHPLISSLYLTDIGHFPEAQFHYRERMEGCDQHILIYCIKGKGWFTIDGNKQPVNQDNLLIIPKGTPIFTVPAIPTRGPFTGFIFWAVNLNIISSICCRNFTSFRSPWRKPQI